MNTQRNLDSLGASELVYDVGGFRGGKPDTGDLEPRLRSLLERYAIVETYADPQTGFKGIALEERNGSGHRIYAMAGVEKNDFDVRDFAAIANLGKPQFTSREAQRLIGDGLYGAKQTG